MSLHCDDDLPLVIPRAKMMKGFAPFAQLVRAVDHGHQLSGFKSLVQIRQVPVRLQEDQADCLVCRLPYPVWRKYSCSTAVIFE